MSLWAWVVAAYDRPGVAEACLELQDEHGQHTSLLLWAAWARNDDPAQLDEAAALARDWDAAVLVPLRGVRRALKASAPSIDEAERLALREDVKAAELRAERVLLQAFEGLGAPGAAEPLAAMAAASRAWGRPAADAELARLAALIG